MNAVKYIYKTKRSFYLWGTWRTKDNANVHGFIVQLPLAHRRYKPYSALVYAESERGGELSTFEL